MNLRFWEKPNGRELPEKVKTTLASQFKLEDQFMGRLRCIERGGHYSGRQVRYIRVFDPTMYQGVQRPIRSYDDLNQNKRGILFEGHMDKFGYIYLADKRFHKSPQESGAAVVASPGR